MKYTLLLIYFFILAACNNESNSDPEPEKNVSRTKAWVTPASQTCLAAVQNHATWVTRVKNSFFSMQSSLEPTCVHYELNESRHCDGITCNRYMWNNISSQILKNRTSPMKYHKGIVRWLTMWQWLLKRKIHLKYTPKQGMHQTLHKPLVLLPLWKSKIKRGVTSHPVHIVGAKEAENLQISRLKWMVKVNLKNIPHLELHQTLL